MNRLDINISWCKEECCYVARTSDYPEISFHHINDIKAMKGILKLIKFIGKKK